MTLYIGDKPVGLMKVVKDTKYIDKTKYGVSIDNILGDVDENGVLQVASVTATTMDLTGVKTLPEQYFTHYFQYDRVKVEHFYAPDLEDMTYLEECSYMFYYNKAIKTAVFGYKEVARQGFEYAFYSTSCVARFPRLKIINGAFAFDRAFSQMLIPFEETFPVLEEVSGNRVFGYIGITNIDKKITIPSLIKIVGATSSTYATFNGISSPKFYLPKCTTLEGNYIFPSSTTEIHFAAENQAAIEASAGYASKWGAGSSCTIFYDL